MKGFELIDCVAFRTLELNRHFNIVAGRSSDRDGRIDLVAVCDYDSTKDMARKRHDVSACIAGMRGVNLVLHNSISPHPIVHHRRHRYAGGRFLTYVMLGRSGDGSKTPFYCRATM